MAKFRNRLVHLYGDIDDRFVYDFTKKDIDNIKAFQVEIVKIYFSNNG